MTLPTEIRTPDAAPPGGPYSQAMLAPPLLFVAGQTPTTAGGERFRGTFAEEAALALSNLRTVVEAAGTDLSHVVRVGVYLASFTDFEAFNGVYTTFFHPPYPARTTIEVRLPGFSLEVDAIAALAPRPVADDR